MRRNSLGVPGWALGLSRALLSQSSWTLLAYIIKLVVNHCMISHKAWVRTHVLSTDCTTVLGVNPLNMHFASQSAIVWNWVYYVMEVIPVEAEMSDGGYWFCILFCQTKCSPFTSCSTTAFLNWSILGAFLKDLAIRIWAFEMLNSWLSTKWRYLITWKYLSLDITAEKNGVLKISSVL